MERKNITVMALVLLTTFAVNSYAQIVAREQLISVNQKLDQYKIGQSTIASGAFSLYDYYGDVGLADIQQMYGQVGVLADRTVQDAGLIQADILRNLDNYENTRSSVRAMLSELRSAHDLAEKQLNETLQEARRVRPAIARPTLLSAQEAGVLVAGSYQNSGVLHYSDASGEQTIAVTAQQVKSGQLPDIIATQLPGGGFAGTTFVEFNQTAGGVQQPAPTDIIPECTLRLQYAVDAVTGSDLVQSQLIALGGSFATELPSCMLKIGGVSFYGVEPARADDGTLYCALPPGFTGSSEAWVIGRGCRESEHVQFAVVGG
jgi:hypothetical protein